ncbi:general odorant-binding protein 19d [Drosophila kikkawai]|uniref:General odorant-binding protein 19d n=1 Tax=Drosophila kikkawai TaxID=30033 RepID=A0A6P4J374_DROKI|nr:uncharacterized protein LOC108079226 [Drosophila kikkawai]KAH8343396.1 hypothetical protein KR059_009990 [Drosophila kikkawai]
MMQSKRMMNQLLLLACAGIFLGSTVADEELSMTLDEVVDLIQPFGEGCDPVPAKENIVEMVQNKEDAKRESKCFRHCLLEQFELMPEGQLQFNEDKTVEMMNMMFPDNEEDSRRITKACNDRLKAEQDKCEAAHGISMCMLKEMRASGLKIPEIKE